jgi:cation/acetate symporter
MLSGLLFTFGYIVYFKFVNPAANIADNWLFGISPEGIGAIGMLINFAVSVGVSRFTAEPPATVQQLIDNIRIPSGAGRAQDH